MNYKFSQFTGTIADPTIEVVSVNDNILTKTCSVDVKLTNVGGEYGISLSGFSYADTWDDADIISWVNNVELPKYAI
jgi:hypothetical protein